MKIPQLILREIRYRWLAFLLAAVSVAVAIVGVGGVLTALACYNARTEQLAQQRQVETEGRMHQLQEEFRKLTLKMGFTTVLVSATENMAEMFARGYAATTMPEEYGDRLAARKPTTINHVLPTLQQRMEWPERGNLPVKLIGVKGEVYVQGKRQLPLLQPVPEHGAVIGQQLQKKFGLKTGDSIEFRGHKLTVMGVQSGEGGPDDVGLWVALPLAQAILNKPGQINEIMAVECMCPGDRVAVIQREIRTILPDVQVFEFAKVASARSEARQRVVEAAAAAAKQERQNREAGKREKELLARVVVPLMILGALVWVGFLMWTNVRDRRAEIGIFGALGLRSWQVALLFLGKALAIGLAGAAIGYPVGIRIGQEWAGEGARHLSVSLAGVPMGAALFIGGLVLVLVATAGPALLAARQDPAAMLREE
ncbi:MAG: ABC transporter permease [Verrucomicrobia bacterium]|nr:ABC transporter permease [Verrucomicrobiota bacterium]